MPVRTYWHDENKNIFITEVEGTWSLDDFYKYFEEAEAIIRQIDHPVVLISDLSKSGRAPKQFLSAGRYLSKKRLPNVRMTIMVGISSFGRTLITIMSRTYPTARKSHIARSMDEAIEMAKQALSSVDTPTK